MNDIKGFRITGGIMQDLIDLSRKLDLDDGELAELIDTAMENTVLESARKVSCPSVFRYENSIGHKDECESDADSDDYIVLTLGGYKFFSIE